MNERTLRINKAIENSGYTYQEIAKITGISKSSLQRYATGETKKIPIDCIEKIAEATGTSSKYLMGWDEPESTTTTLLDSRKIRMIPVFESVSAGFGAYADSRILEYTPCFIESDCEASETLCIKVSGNSMYPKIEDGDTIQVRKQSTVDSGQIAVVLVDGDDGRVKRVVYGDNWMELQSINPEYQAQRFENNEIDRIRIVGLVRKIIKDV